jgi:putative membrane protein
MCRRANTASFYTVRMPWVLRLAIAWGFNAAALWVANALWDGVRIHGWGAYLIGAAVLGIANTVIKPVLTVLTLPLIIVTLGFFYLVINIAMVALAAWITPNFSIHGFWTYVGIVVVVWAVNWIADHIMGDVERRPRGRLIVSRR